MKTFLRMASSNVHYAMIFIFYYFISAALREITFRKMSYVAYRKWSCNNCKFNENIVLHMPEKLLK